MKAVRVEITRFIDGSYPGFVEFRLVDAEGRTTLFEDKISVVTAAALDAGSTYPQPGVVACEIVGRHLKPDGHEIVQIDTEFPWHVESKAGETRFEVFAEQLTDIP